MLRKHPRVVGLLSLAASTYGYYKWHNNKYNKQQHINDNAKRVAVIGAGVSGIVTTKWLMEAGYNVKTFEQANGIGGNWYHQPIANSPSNGADAEEQFSSCYKNLKVLTTSTGMSLEGFPIPKNIGRYPMHSKILKYLTHYCDEHKLWGSFAFSTKVISVRSVEGGYNVTSSKDGIETNEFFDAVAVCNGHNSNPYWPEELLKNIKNFSGEVIHSRSYRSPTDFRGKRVLVLGGGVSGKQIALDISFKAKSVALSTQRPMKQIHIYKENPNWMQLAKFTGNLVQIVPGLANTPFSGKEVQFTDGSKSEYDAIIVCTGYKSSFPFLDKDIADSVVRYPEGKSHPAYLWLYKHTFPMPISDSPPTLAFIGMMDVVGASMFPVADVQAKWFSLLLSSKTRLPPQAKVEQEMQTWQQMLDLSYHPMSLPIPRQYCENIAKLIEENRLR